MEILKPELTKLLDKLEKELKDLRTKRDVFMDFEYLDTRKMTQEEKEDYQKRMKIHLDFGKTVKKLNYHADRIPSLEFAIIQLKLIIAKQD
jgi:hypothetical protein